MYQDQAHKNNALRGLVDALKVWAQDKAAHNTDTRTAYRGAAARLEEILDTPVDSPYDAAGEAPTEAPGAVHVVFRPGDLAVVVAMPDSAGWEQVITFDRNGGGMETLPALDRLIIKALLLHAMDEVRNG